MVEKFLNFFNLISIVATSKFVEYYFIIEVDVLSFSRVIESYLDYVFLDDGDHHAEQVLISLCVAIVVGFGVSMSDPRTKQRFRRFIGLKDDDYEIDPKTGRRIPIKDVTYSEALKVTVQTIFVVVGGTVILFSWIYK